MKEAPGQRERRKRQEEELENTTTPKRLSYLLPFPTTWVQTVPRLSVSFYYYLYAFRTCACRFSRASKPSPAYLCSSDMAAAWPYGMAQAQHYGEENALENKRRDIARRLAASARGMYIKKKKKGAAAGGKKRIYITGRHFQTSLRAGVTLPLHICLVSLGGELFRRVADGTLGAASSRHARSSLSCHSLAVLPLCFRALTLPEALSCL